MVANKLPEPFFFENGSRAVLLLHAYTGSPNDVRMLGRALQKENYTVYAPVFKGHETADPEDILAAQPVEWIADAKKAVQFLEEKGHKQLAVFGLSLGGIIANKIMLEKKMLAGGVFCSPAISKSQNRIKKTFLAYLRSVKKKKGYSAEEIEGRMPGIEQKLDQQLKGISEIIRSMENHYDQLTNPLFIAQAGKDELLDPQMALEFKNRLINAKVDFHWYENSTHVVTVGSDHKELEADVLNFLSELKWNGE